MLLKIFLLLRGGGVCCFHKLLELVDGKGHSAISKIFHGKETVNDVKTVAKFEPVLAVYLNSALTRA